MILIFLSITYSADLIKFYPDEKRVVLMGNAEVVDRDLKVNAQLIEYLTEEKRMIATGNPVLYSGEKTIYAERMEYNLDKKVGVIYNGKTKTEKGWFWGKKVYYTDDHSLYIIDGRFTTCDKDPPHYFFYSPRMRVEPDRDIVASNVFLLIMKIPVFYLPFWMSPSGKKRKSGFLAPSFGSQSYGGRYIKNIGWYQTLGEHSDITFWIDYYTSKGVMPHVEFRWLGMGKSSINLYGDYIRELSGRERWKINGDGSFLLPVGIKGRYRIDYASDRELYADYVPGEVTPIIQDAEAYAEFTKSVTNGNLDLLLRRKKNLSTGEESGVMPSFTYTFYNIRVGPISIGGKIPYQRNIDGECFLYPGVSFSMSKSLFPLNFSGSFHIDGYHASNTVDSLPYTGYHYSYSFSVNTRIYALSTFGLFMFKRFRFVYTPSIGYSFSPPGDSVELLPGTPFSIPGGSKGLNIGLGILWQAKVNSKRMDLVSISTGTSYDYENNQFRPITISASSNPTKDLNIGFSTTYNLYEKIFSSRNVNITYNGKFSLDEKKYKFSLRYSLTFDDSTFNQAADISADLPITKKWSGSISTHYDFRLREFQSTKISLERDLHCWKIALSYNKFGTSWDYGFTLSLKGIPEVKLEKNTLRFLFP